MARIVLSSLLLAFIFFSFSADARDVLVGGKADAWKVPSSESDSLNKWAEKARFLIGDSLVWKYDGSKDSVMQVSQADYVNCNTTSPIEEYKDGSTKVKLERSGAFFFISGAKGHCEKGEKLHVVVMAPRHRSMAPAPAPGPVGYASTALPPAATGSASSLSWNGAGALFLVAAMGVLAL